MCFAPAPTASRADPVSVTTSQITPTAPGNSNIDDGATGNNGTVTRATGQSGVIPAEELNQVAPRKKAGNTQAANALAIGTKKYRTGSDVGLGIGNTTPSVSLAGASK